MREQKESATLPAVDFQQFLSTMKHPSPSLPAQPRHHIGVIGYACGVGGSVPGAEHGPAALREADLQKRLETLHCAVTDFGDTTGALGSELGTNLKHHSLKHLSDVTAHCEELYALVTKALTAHTTPLVLGGDHSLSIGSIAAVRDRIAGPIGALWIDTHPDINTPQTSPSQRIHGMSVAALLGLMPGVFTHLQRPEPALLPKHVIYIGLRDVDPGERELIRTLGIRAYTMKDVDTKGLARVMEEALSYLNEETAGVVVSFDLDVCDPTLVPGTGTPIRGGLTYREAHLAMELIADSANLLALELVELNPTLDRKNRTTELAVALIESTFGKSIL